MKTETITIRPKGQVYLTLHFAESTKTHCIGFIKNRTFNTIRKSEKISPTIDVGITVEKMSKALTLKELKEIKTLIKFDRKSELMNYYRFFRKKLEDLKNFKKKIKIQDLHNKANLKSRLARRSNNVLPVEASRINKDNK
ncbi:MAG TPA: hypothetical protein VIK14_16840 [Ignavibacteria bacterium]